jgi:hypothetical protein
MNIKILEILALMFFNEIEYLEKITVIFLNQKNQKRSLNKFFNKSKNLKSYWMSHNINFSNAVSFCVLDLFSCFILEIE